VIGFKKIILTTDLSENANAATPYAVELAKKYGGDIYLVHVFEDSIYYVGTVGGEGLPYDPAKWLAAAHDSRDKQIKALAAKLSEANKIKVIPVVKQGQPAPEMVKFAKEQDADCIVIATHGHTGFSRMLFGSVAEKIVRLSPCPVLSVRPKDIPAATV
jgi:nucleotide-binding universal stress UspA family protein